jgi:hypothetical protein
MNRPLKRALQRLAAIAAVVVPIAALAAAGEFTFVVGAVTLTKANGQSAAAQRGTPVDPGDRVSTGADGMAQLTMVDQARLSLRPNTQFAIEQYPQQKESATGSVLNLLKGTLRTFTGLIASANRDKFVMKTRVATVGIRGSGNILYACEGAECDASVIGEAKGEGSITVNHTIEGSHAVTNVLASAPAGTPAQQGGPQTLVTGPGQTVLVLNNQPPRYIPTPSFIANAATNPTNAKAEVAAAVASGGPVRSFAPGDVITLPASQQATTPIVGNNGLGFPTIDATGNLAQDPTNLRDILISAGGATLPGQATAGDITLSGNDLRGYRAYGASQSGLSPVIEGGTLRDFQTVAVGNASIIMGRWENASLGFFGTGSQAAIPGSVHWIMAPSGYPMYLADVLTGTASYTLAGATSPTNQNGTAGSIGAATLDANFTNRTLNFGLAVSVPGSAGGNWNLSASNVPISLNRFFGSTSDRLVITNGAGQSSSTNGNLSGSFEGSFVGTGLTGAILGYGISDRTHANASSWAFISGVAGFSGPAQNGAAPYREGRVSDAAGSLAEFIRSYSTTDRPEEVVSDTSGRVTAFTAPFGSLGSHASYALGTAQVVQSGADPETGLIWGRWSGGTAQVNGQALSLANASLHYIFAGTQSGPVTLPLTGTATYDVIGSTSPTDFNGHVGTLNAARLDANFSNRTASAAVNLSINGQTWNGVADNMPIYRDQYFSAYSGTPIAGVPNPNPLAISCTPSCGQNATGSFDGFFTGRSGARAGMMYNLGGNQGAVAFGRRGG